MGESLPEMVAGIVGGLLMAACVIGLVRVVQLRRRRRRAAELGMGADERRFKRRLERQLQEVDDLFGDADEEEDDDGGDDLEGAELDEEDVENLQLLEQEMERKQQQQAAGAGTPSKSPSKQDGSARRTLNMDAAATAAAADGSTSTGSKGGSRHSAGKPATPVMRGAGATAEQRPDTAPEAAAAAASSGSSSSGSRKKSAAVAAAPAAGGKSSAKTPAKR